MARRGNQDRGKGQRRMRRDEPIIRKRAKCLDDVKTIDPNNFEFLSQFITEHGKIMPGRLTGAKAKEQRKIKKGIRCGRIIGLIS